MKRLFYAVAGIAISGAGAACARRCYPPGDRVDYTRYEFTQTAVTPRHAIPVSDAAGGLDLKGLDDAVDATLACVQKQWPLMTPADLDKGRCPNPHDIFGFRRRNSDPKPVVLPCLRVLVPPDWHTSACTSKQVFPCSVPEASCRQKGMEPTAQCPCACRAIQQGETIVTAPDLELFSARLTELVTGCDQIWSTPLAACGAPPPLLN